MKPLVTAIVHREFGYWLSRDENEIDTCMDVISKLWDIPDNVKLIEFQLFTTQVKESHLVFISVDLCLDELKIRAKHYATWICRESKIAHIIESELQKRKKFYVRVLYD